MTVRKAYSRINLSGCMRNILTCRFLLFSFSLLFLYTGETRSQELPEYDEILISLEIPRIGTTEIDAVIRGEELYLPITDLFDFLKIRNVPSPGMESISGFFIIPEATYEINRTANNIIYQGKRYNLEPGDLIRTESNLYLKSSYYGKVFGLECTFNFRSLSVILDSKLELPLIREMRQEEMRRNLTKLKGEEKADTTIGRTYPLFKFGMADWSAITTEEINGKTDARFNLTLGSILAGGEATASINYSNSVTFTEKQQYYLWRFVNNDFKPLRQVMAGKISTHSVSTVYNPVIGIQLTNTPTTYRRSFGTYSLNDKTEPGWIVELYVNSVLVDYVKADASGFFNFEVPLVYGNSLIKLKYFGPWGEERTREQNITIPFNFLPPKIMEYTVSAGIVEDTLASRFSRASINYGLTRSLTVGGGAEYLSSVSSGPLMPYLNASLRLTNNLLLSGEYTYGVRAKANLTYRLPSNIQFDLNYTLYDQDQTAINYNYREERKASVSLPLKIGKFSSYNRLSAYQIVLPSSYKYTTAEWMISGSLSGVSTNLTTYAIVIDKAKPYLYSNLSVAFRLPAGFILMPQAQYTYTQNQFLSAKAVLEKHLLKHGFMNLSYEQNFKNNLKMAELGFRYDFSFAQTGLSVRQSNEKTSFVQYARGSLINDRKTRYLGTDNRTNVGRGGISIVPFLDLNNNGKKDPGEPKVYGLNLHSSNGRIEKSDRDTTIRILGLEPYTTCFIDLDPNSFENISWRLSKQSYGVAVDPDILKLVEIAINIAGEVNGTIVLESEGELRGQGRIIVNFYDGSNKLIGRTLTEVDGYYSYLGLTPGNYSAQVDTAQLRKLKMTSAPELRKFKIAGGPEGDIADGLDFVLKMVSVDTTTAKPVPQEVPFIKKDTTFMTIHELTEEVYTITKDSWAIQIGAFKSKSYAEGFQKMLESNLGKQVQITIEGEFYRVRILDLSTREEVDENIVKLNKLGFRELWIIHLLARQQQRLLITKEDSLARIKESFIEKEEALSEAETALLQIGAFRLRSDAIALRKGLSTPLNEKATIEPGNKYYKLQTPAEPIIDQTALEAIDDLLTSVGKIALKDEWAVPAKRETIEVPVERIPVEIQKASIKPDTSLSVIRTETRRSALQERPPVPEPTIALQVAIYHQESRALRAQRKIMSKLNLPVDIVKQFDYYHVIVTGFYTREQTFPYYPELAGIGYPGVTLIQNYKSQK